jgi:phosphate uptake regulator
VDRLAVKIIALRAPVADDLREVLAALKIAGILERIGDYAKNIAKRVSRIEGRLNSETQTLIPAMAEIAGEMVHDVLTAFAARDPSLAVDVIERDARVDAFYDSIFRNMVSFMMENPPPSPLRRTCYSLRAISNGSAITPPILPNRSISRPPLNMWSTGWNVRKTNLFLEGIRGQP